MAESIEFSFVCGELPADEFAVLGFTGNEAISQLYRFEIDLVSETPDIDIDNLQDQPSTLTISTGARERRIQGVLAKVGVLDQADDYTIYRVALVPRVWELTLGTSTAVHLDQATPDVLHAALEQHLGITSADYDKQLNGGYRSWPFRLQYGESHWDFLARLMERDGIYYYFTAGDEVERIVFCDSRSEQPGIKDGALRYSPSLGMDADAGGQTIDSFVMQQRRVPKLVTIQNYNDDTPSTPIRESAEVDARGSGAVHLYGQTVLDPSEARTIVGIRAEELFCTKVTYESESTAFELASAHRFELTDHPRADNNREYQIVAIEHSAYNSVLAGKVGRQQPEGTAAYENRFTAIPADRQYRSSRVTDWPRIRGTINAVIDAEGDGQYAELDEEGRYHVVFPFHEGFHSGGRKDAGKSSHPVRMMQPFGGPYEGMHLPLRKGTRVLIGFQGGNPDLPVITGTVPTAEHRSVVDADDHTRNRIRTSGGNEIELEDNEGREGMRLHSPHSHTTISLGAGKNDLEGAASVGAAANLPETLAPSGAVVATVGQIFAASFGATNYNLLTNAWAVPQTLWGNTQFKREGQLADADDDPDTDTDLASRADLLKQTDCWYVDYGPQGIFRFPRKHDIPSSMTDPVKQYAEYEKYITTAEEGEGRLHISRRVGDGYSFSSGSSFNFSGYDSESYTFGPSASYTTTDYTKTADELRDIVRSAIPDLSHSGADAFRALDDVRAALADAEAIYEERSKRLDTLQNEATQRAEANDDVAGDWPLHFNRRSTFEEWAKLANRDSSAAQGWQAVTPNSVWNEILEGDSDWLRDYLANPSAMEAPDPPLNESVAQAKKDLDDQFAAYEQQLWGVRDTAADETTGWSKTVREGRVSVSLDCDEFYWRIGGNVYDFGGQWNYNLGNCYVENLMDQDLSKIDKSGYDHDLTDTGGPDWGKLKVDSALGEMKNGEVWVDKSIGDTYSYHKGKAVSVHVGASHSISKVYPVVEEKYSKATDIRVEKTRADDGVTEVWRKHLQSGIDLYYSRETWGVSGHQAGKNSFSTEFAPSISMDIKASFSQANNIQLSVANNMNLNVGVTADVNIFVGAKMALSLSAAMDADFKFAPIRANFSNGHMDIKIPGIMVKKTPTEMENKMADLEKSVTKLQNQNVVLQNRTVSLSKKQVELNSMMLCMFG